MKANAVFTQNLLDLYESHEPKLNKKSLTALINLRSGEGAIDYSYVNKMMNKALGGEHINPSIEKAEAIATGLGVTLRRMLCVGVTNNEQEIDFNTKHLIDAYSHVDIFCENLEINDLEFKAKALEIQYMALLKGNDTETSAAASASLQKLCKEYGY